MRRREVLLQLGLGLAGVVVLVVVAVVADLAPSLPAVLALGVVAVLPLARAYGAARTREAGRRARERREGR